MPKNSRIERDGDFWTRYKIKMLNKAIELYYEIAQKITLNLSLKCL